MRASAAAFFSAGARDLVSDFDPEKLILDCYRLADRFHQIPDVFLEMPISAVDRHLYYTVMLHRKQQEANAPDDDD